MLAKEGGTMNLFAQLAMSFLPIIIKALSPVIKVGIGEFATMMYLKCKETPNPIDDAFIVSILSALDMPTPVEVIKDEK